MCPIPFVGVGVAKDVACLWERKGHSNSSGRDQL